MNYAENLLSRSDDGIAVTFAREDALVFGSSFQNKRIRHVSWRELRSEVTRWAAALRIEGVSVGDRVAGASQT